MTSEGLGEMFEGDSADTLTGKFPLVLMGGRVEGLACADPVARTPIGASGNSSCSLSLVIWLLFSHKNIKIPPEIWWSPIYFCLANFH